MALNVLVVAILSLVIGLAFCFAGYRFFRLLVAIWGFFAGRPWSNERGGSR